MSGACFTWRKRGRPQLVSGKALAAGRIHREALLPRRAFRRLRVHVRPTLKNTQPWE